MIITDVRTTLLTGPCTNDPFLREARKLRSAAFIEVLTDSGPIGIGQVIGAVSHEGFIPLVHLVALLSISLGLINLFPIPVLDGGHLLFYAIEAVSRRPVSERALAFGFRVGFALIVSFFVFVMWHDLSRLFHLSSGT